MLSLSLMLKEMRQKISNLEIGGSGTLSIDTSRIMIGNVTYDDDNPSVSTRYQNGNVYFDFVLTNPITDAKRFGTVVVKSTMHHVVDRKPLTENDIASIALSEVPNTCPVIVSVAGCSYFETGSGDDVFTVNRKDKTVIWHSTKAGFGLNTDIASTVYVHYEVSESVSQKVEYITVSSIVDNGFKLSDVPNSTKVTVIINGVSYFEEGGEFTVNRSVTPTSITWNMEKTGFSLDSSLTGYIKVIYDVNL